VRAVRCVAGDAAGRRGRRGSEAVSTNRSLTASAMSTLQEAACPAQDEVCLKRH